MIDQEWSRLSTKADWLATLGLLMMLSIVAVNSWIAFFVQREYTMGMLCASAFWFLGGWLILKEGIGISNSAHNDKYRKGSGS